MIVLDANYLIAAPNAESAELARISAWCEAGETLATTAIAWTEFLSGPVDDDDVVDVRLLLEGGVLGFDEASAGLAATLFNAIGRRRTMRVDSMIAATTILHGGRLATRDVEDFRLFGVHGLQLI